MTMLEANGEDREVLLEIEVDGEVQQRTKRVVPLKVARVIEHASRTTSIVSSARSSAHSK
jgi:hypothetical protein